MILIMIRHGKTLANEQSLYCGKTDIGLSENGVMELTEIKRNTVYPDVSQMKIVTSGMKRCDETLSLLFGDLDHVSDPAFCEMDFGAFEMRSYDEMKNDPEYISWISGDNESNVTPGGESGKMMKERVLSGLKRLISDGKDALLITHGGVIAAVMADLFPGENKNRYEWQPLPGKGYIIDTDKRTYSLL